MIRQSHPGSELIGSVPERASLIESELGSIAPRRFSFATIVANSVHVKSPIRLEALSL